VAYKLGVDIVSAVLVGLVIGYWLDVWLKTSPLFLIIFIIMGAVAGFLNVYRSTKRMMGAPVTHKDSPDA
jgi:ATP synthase protein I